MAKLHSHGLSEVLAADRFMRPLSPGDDHPEVWTAKGLLMRAYYRAGQQELWKTKQTAPVGIGQDTRFNLTSLHRRFSTVQAPVHFDPKIFGDPGPDTEADVNPSAPSKRAPKIQRATSVYFHPDEEEAGSRGKAQEAFAGSIQGPAGDTGADEGAQAPGTTPAADTGGTPPLQGVNPLKELMTAKKVDVAQLQALLKGLPNVEHWVNAPLDPGPPVMPAPLFFAIGATLPSVVGLLLEFSADSCKAYDGTKMYNGWIKPSATPIEAVTNRRGRFVGTMLGDRLDEILELLYAAQARANPKKEEAKEAEVEFEKRLSRTKTSDDVRKRMGKSKSFRMSTPRGIVEHTQGHPSEKYNVVAELGESALSTVKMAVCHRTGEMHAIKAEFKIAEGSIWDELSIMRKLYHPNVIRLYETFEDELNVFAVLEVCSGGELFSRLVVEGNIPERYAARLMKQLASAVEYIHNQNVCHRDIQPENFLLKDEKPLSEASPVLIDFTTAREFGPNNPMKTKICTLHYVAPEILTRKDVAYTEKVDIWSLGILFYVMLCGSPPFYADNDLTVLKRIKRGAYKFNPPEVWSQISDEAKDLVQRMLVLDVDQRLSGTAVFSHAWLHADFKHQDRPVGGTAGGESGGEHLSNLRNFHERTRVQNAVSKLRDKIIFPGALEELRRIFQSLDSESKGALLIADLRDTIRREPQLNDSIQEIMHILWDIDKKRGAIDFGNVLREAESRNTSIQQQACRAVFDFFARNNTITEEDVKMALGLGCGSDSFKLEALWGMQPGRLKSHLERQELVNMEYRFDEFFELISASIGGGDVPRATQS